MKGSQCATHAGAFFQGRYGSLRPRDTPPRPLKHNNYAGISVVLKSHHEACAVATIDRGLAVRGDLKHHDHSGTPLYPVLPIYSTTEPSPEEQNQRQRLLNRSIRVGETQHVFKVNPHTKTSIQGCFLFFRNALGFVKNVRIVPVDEYLVHVGSIVDKGGSVQIDQLCRLYSSFARAIVSTFLRPRLPGRHRGHVNQPHDPFHVAQGTSQPCLHRWRHAQAHVNPAEVIVHCPQVHHCDVLGKHLREGVGLSSIPSVRASVESDCGAPHGTSHARCLHPSSSGTARAYRFFPYSFLAAFRYASSASVVIRGVFLSRPERSVRSSRAALPPLSGDSTYDTNSLLSESRAVQVQTVPACPRSSTWICALLLGVHERPYLITLDVAPRCRCPAKHATMNAMATTEPTAPAPASRRPLASLLCDVLPPQGAWSDEAYLWLTDHSRRLIDVHRRARSGTAHADRHPPGRPRLPARSVPCPYQAARWRRDRSSAASAPCASASGKFREPDLLLLRTARTPAAGIASGLGADLVVEIVEARTDPGRDLIEKRADYAEGGIPEYWIVVRATRRSRCSH